MTQARTGRADRPTPVTITTESPSPVAFLLRADVRRSTASGQELARHNALQASISQNNDITPGTVWPPTRVSSQLRSVSLMKRSTRRRVPGSRGNSDRDGASHETAQLQANRSEHRASPTGAPGLPVAAQGVVTSVAPNSSFWPNAATRSASL